MHCRKRLNQILESRKKGTLQKSTSISDFKAQFTDNNINSNNNNSNLSNSIDIRHSHELSTHSLSTISLSSSYDNLFENDESSSPLSQKSLTTNEDFNVVKSNSSQIENKFLLSCFSADLDEIKTIVSNNPTLDVSAVGEFEYDNAIFRACKRQNNTLTVIKYLVEELKININHTNKRGHTALHKLCMANPLISLDSIKWVIEEQNMDVNVMDLKGRTPLFYLVEYRNRFADQVVKVLHYLINQGANVLAIDDKGENCLHHGCGLGNASTEVIEVILDTGIDINLQSGEDKYTPLFHLIRYNSSNHRVSLAKLLIQRGADISITDSYGNTAFMLACSSETKLELAQFIYHEGADIYKKNNENLSALEVAYQSPSVLTWLLSIGAHHHLNQMALDELLLTAAMCPAIRLESIIALFSEGANIHHSSNGRNLLHISCGIFFYYFFNI